jgi:hypothetical protein
MSRELSLGNSQWTARELAAHFGCDERSVQRYAVKLFPSKIKHGIKTYFNEAEATLILEEVKKGATIGAGVKSDNDCRTVSTPLSTIIRTKEFADSLEVKEKVKAAMILHAEAMAALQNLNENLQERLSESEDWWSVKRVEVETGRRYSWKPLKRASITEGYGIGKAFDQNYGEVNLYHVDVWNKVYGLEL